MARDVEFNYTASDKTGPAADSAQRRMKQTGDAGKKQAKEIENTFAKGVVAIASSVSPKLGKALTDSFASAAEVGPQLIVAGVAAAAPFAGALISAGIIGGVGLGGVVGGFALASKDPRVQASFASMKTDIGDQLKDASKPFIDVSLDGIDQIGRAVKTIDFDDIFAKSAKNAAPIITGISDAVQDLGKGVQVVIDKSGPVMEALGQSISELGSHTAGFLETIAGGSDGAAAAVRDLTSAITSTEDTLGPVIRGLTEVYGWFSKIGALKGIFANPLVSFIPDLLKAGEASGQLRFAKKGIDDVAAAAAAAQGPIQTMTEKIDELSSAGRSLYDSSTQVGAALDNVAKAAKHSSDGLSANTEKGRANRDALSNLAGALVANYDAYVKVNGEGSKSNAIAASNRAQFVKLAGQFTKTKGDAERLATQMGLIPAKKQTSFTANTHDAAARIEALKEKANSIKNRTVTISVVTAGVNAAVSRINSALGKFGHLFDAQQSFAFAGLGGPVEPARQTQVSADVTSKLYLDGSLVYANTAMQVRAASKRDAWRQRVGTR